MSEKRKILRASGLLGLLTLLSRFTGLARDIAMAANLGATLTSDVFNFAFELPNLARRVLGEGALSSVIVPLFAGRKKLGGEREAWLFFNRAFNAVGLLTIVLTLFGMIFSQEIFNFFGGFGILAHREGIDEATAQAAVHQGSMLTRVMFPQMITLAVGSIMMGVCHSYGSFGIPAFGSIVLNISMIAASILALSVGSSAETASRWLAWSVLAGALIRMLIMIPKLTGEGWRWKPEVSFRDPEVRQMFGMMAVGLIGLSINHINIAVAGIFAGYLGPGNKTYLVYSNRLIQFPMALTATALATAMLPRLSHLLLEGDTKQLREVMGFTKRLELVFIVPSTLGLIFFAQPIVELLFQRRGWTAEHSEGTAQALLFYAPALLPFGWSRLLIPLYHARKDVMTPVKAAGFAVVVNISLAAYFTFYTSMAQRGLALASTLAAFADYGYMAWATRSRIGIPSSEPGAWTTLVKCVAAGVISIGAGAIAYHAIVGWIGAPATTVTRGALLLPLLALASVAYFMLIHFFRVQDSDRAVEMIKRRLISRRTNLE